MKIHWGTAIAIFYSCFVATMISVVIFSTKNKSYLVQENYYAKDLAYEAFRSKRENANKMAEPIKIDYSQEDRIVVLTFPLGMEKSQGEVMLYRPSNKSFDKKTRIVLDENRQMSIKLKDLDPSGLWKIKVDWSSKEKKYFTEEKIFT